jgi:hypothetical protein
MFLRRGLIASSGHFVLLCFGGGSDGRHENSASTRRHSRLLVV